MKTIEQYNLEDLKVIYLLLHENIVTQPALMDSDLLQDLQTYLQQQARQQGIDVSLHAQWSSWLNGGASLKGL